MFGRGRRCKIARWIVGARRGFSLIELVVVLSILGVAAAVVVPAFTGFVSGGAEEAVRELVSAYRTARNEAVTRGVGASVTIELSTGSYWVVSEPLIGGHADTLRAGALPLGQGTRLLGGRQGWAVTAFDPLARARGAPVFISDGEKVYEVAVDARTAEIDARRR